MDSYPQTPRTTATRYQDRIHYDRQAVHRVLDEALLCHVAFVADARPVVLPHLFARIGDVLYLHGSTGARAMRQGGPLPVCVTVTHVDALVLTRSAFHHSVNYRSVVAHGDARPVTDPVEKARALDALVDAVVPGRSAATRKANRKELAATALLALELTEVSLKVRNGPPGDDEADLDLPHWAGVLPLRTVRDTPVPAADLDPSIPLPEHLSSWVGAGV